MTHAERAAELLEEYEGDAQATLTPDDRGDLLNELELTLELVADRVLKLAKPWVATA